MNENKALKECREFKNLSIAEVALQADMTDVGYLYLEQGKRTPLVTTAIRVANALGITDYRSFKKLWLQK